MTMTNSALAVVAESEVTIHPIYLERMPSMSRMIC
jgi:hypothetical protein